jgi:hypothetical protein
MKNNKQTIVVSFPFMGLLCLMFIGLKLTHYIDWSWWWVLCPLWIGPAAILVIVGIVLFSIVVVSIMEIITGGKF